MYIKRTIEDSILKTSQTFPVLLVTGPRQVGKTTVLKHLAENDRTYITLDDPAIRFLAKNDPALFMQRFSPPIIIDEIQYAPEILPYIKMEVDRSGKNGEFWLTGSQMFHMMKNVSESLAGRVGILRLLGLTYSETRGLPSVPFTTEFDRLLERVDKVQPVTVTEIYRQIYKGGLPALYKNPEVDLETFFASYINSYLQRDIRDLTQVADEMVFYNFMISIAARTGKPVNYDEISRDAGISAPTAKRWLSILISSGLVALVQPYSNNMLKRIVKMPLLYFLDTGLCAHLLKWKSPETLELGAMSGQFFESWVFSEIYKTYLNAGQEPPLLYYRDKDKREIDLLLHYDNTLFPVEIKKSAAPQKSTIKHFNVLNPLIKEKQISVGSGAIICMSANLLPLDEDNSIIPAWLI